MLATTVAWDTDLSWTYGEAITALQSTLRQVPTCTICWSLCLFPSCFRRLLFFPCQREHARFFFSISLLDMQVSSMVTRLQKEVPYTYILSNNYIPSKMHWDVAVNKSLRMINRKNSPLIKVINYTISFSAVLVPSASWLFCAIIPNFFLYFASILLFLMSTYPFLASTLSWKFRLFLHAVQGLWLPQISIL